MAFVKRDRDTGVVRGVFANAQPGRAEEELPDDHPDVLAFRAAPSPAPVKTREEAALEVLIEKGLVTEAEIAAKRR
jgi:hypothetical protein